MEFVTELLILWYCSKKKKHSGLDRLWMGCHYGYG
jgi:hypothetical protein